MRCKNLKIFAVLTGSLFVLCGCGKKSNDNASIEHTLISTSSEGNRTTAPELLVTNPVTIALTSTTYTSSKLLTSSMSSTLLTSSSSTSLTSLSYFYDITTETITNNDLEILDYFGKMGDIVKESFNSEDLLDKGKSYFIYCVDFLFYDGEINGIRFNDMTDSAKEQLLRDISTIDSLICSKYPNYKEDIKEGYGNAYNKASEVIRVGSENINEFSRDKLGEENYNKLKEYKDLFVDTAFGDWDDFVDILGKGKQKLKDWYEGLK